LSVSQGQGGSRLGSPANPNDIARGTSSTSTNTPSNSPANANQSSAPGKSTPTTLASTGPKETIAVFVTFSIFGTLFYRRYLAKNIA
jgi:hypothetical protein